MAHIAVQAQGLEQQQAVLAAADAHRHPVARGKQVIFLVAAANLS